MLSRFEFIAVNKFLIITHPLGKIVGIGHLHFNIERAIGALFLNVNVEPNAFAVGAKIDSLFALGVVDFTDFDVQNEFK